MTPRQVGACPVRDADAAGHPRWRRGRPRSAMMGRMRRGLLWLLLALLPWRLWAADAMALRPCQAATVPAAGSAHAGPEAATHAAPTHTAHLPEAQASTPASDGSGHATCTLCDLCHNGALAVAVPAATGIGAPQDWWWTQWPLPPSTAAPPLLKPPIA